MNWEVQIAGDVTDLKELSKSLKDDELRVMERDDQYFLVSVKFYELATSEEVTSTATEILQLLTASARLALGGRTPIEIVNIARIRGDGGKDIFVSASETAHARDMFGIEIHRKDGTVEVFNPADKVPDWIRIGLSDEKVAKVLRLFGANEHDWVSLYRLYEVIEDDIGGIEKITGKGWITKTLVKRFKHTANSPSVVGDTSRHGKESTSPPKNPMNLAEAKSLIEVILHNWLRSKLED